MLDVRERSGEVIAGIALETSEAILVRKLPGRVFGFGTFAERDVLTSGPQTATTAQRSLRRSGH